MNSKRWQQVRKLFLAACDLEGGERDAFLSRACRDDATLRAEVEEILDSSEASSSLFRDLIPGGPQPEAGEEPINGPLAGRPIGAYRLLWAIASGGMGTVYLAERADAQFRKTVAVKLIRPGMISDEDSLRRFRNEQQALATLEHPNIARLHDGGVTEDGIPYLVMEYVEGRPIDVYCDEHHLSINRRLDLFRFVCSAVQYAHQNFIIHRDLKPSNILVTADGEPKLLDFGIAKMLQPVEGPRAMPETLTERRAMTPEYASPEQVRGEPVTTASDVYSLGVVLYQLLTGHLPYRLKTGLVSELERTILDAEPTPPSSVVWRVEETSGESGESTCAITPQKVSELRESSPRRLSGHLRGDLDNIVLMALRKDPRRRYATADQLADDIDHHRAKRPVTAAKDSLGYRTIKFARRHAAGLVATFIVILSLTAGAIGIAREARIAARQRDEAVSANAKAEAIVAFLQEMLTSVHPASQGRDVSVREVLDKATARIEKNLQVDSQVKASLYGTFGRAYSSLGLYDQAEANLRKALDLHRAATDGRREEVVQSLNDLGDLLFATGDLDQAEPLLREALASGIDLFGNDHPTTVRIKVNLADVLGEHRDVAEAERLLQEVLDTRRARLGPLNLEVAETLDRFANVADRKGDWDAASRLLEEALLVRRDLLAAGNPVVLESILKLAGVLNRKGDHEAAARLYGEAEPFMREALSMHRRVLGDTHIMTLVLTNGLGELLHGKGDLEAAESLFREALNASETLLEEQSESTVRSRNNHTAIMHNLAIVLLGRKQAEEAYELLRKSLAVRRETLGPDHLDVAEVLSGLAEAARQRGDTAAAADFLNEALGIYRRRLPQNHPLVVDTRDMLSTFAASK